MDNTADLAAAEDTPMREAQIATAVKFLSDSRVQSAPADKAAAFLKRKGLTEPEVAEAFRRVGKPYPPESTPTTAAPPTTTTATTPSAIITAPQPPPQQLLALPPGSKVQLPESPLPPRRSPFVTLLLAFTGTVSVVVVLRELLKRYIVPLYYPQQEEESTKVANALADTTRRVRKLEEALAEMSVERERAERAEREVRDLTEALRKMEGARPLEQLPPPALPAQAKGLDDDFMSIKPATVDTMTELPGVAASGTQKEGADRINFNFDNTGQAADTNEKSKESELKVLRTEEEERRQAFQAAMLAEARSALKNANGSPLRRKPAKESEDGDAQAPSGVSTPGSGGLRAILDQK